MLLDEERFNYLMEQARDKVRKAHTAEGVYEMQKDTVCRKIADELAGESEEVIYYWLKSHMYLNEDFGVTDVIISFYDYFNWEV